MIVKVVTEVVMVLLLLATAMANNAGSAKTDWVALGPIMVILELLMGSVELKRGIVV